MKKILVTGGAGYIGSHMVLTLLENGYEPIVLDNYINSNPYNLNKVKELTGKDFTIIEHDLNTNLKVLDEYEIEAIIHFAALKAVGESVINPSKYYSNNVVGTINLIDYSVKNKINKFIFSSTAAVYSSDAEVPLKESSLVGPASPYGYTKLFSEQVLKDIAKTGAINSIALRYFNVAGNQKDGVIGEISNNPQNLIPSIVFSHLGYRENNLKVFGNDYPTRDGTAIRDYVHVLDLCSAHLKALGYLNQNKGNFTFNLGTKNGSTIMEVIETFEKVTGEKLNFEMVERRPGDIAVSIADSSLALEKLKWKPIYSLEQMIESSYKWYKSGFKEANELYAKA